MQTIEQLLANILKLRADAERQGQKPDLVLLSAEDEITLAVHAWLRAEAEKPGALTNTPPNVRSNLRGGYGKLAGLDVQWDAERTEVRARSAEEESAHKESVRRNLQAMQEVNQSLADHAGKGRRGILS